jgi:hypothetical protein
VLEPEKLEVVRKKENNDGVEGEEFDIEKEKPDRVKRLL